MTVARRSWSLALAAVAGVIPSTAMAQGFGLNEIGSCAVGRGFTVTARPCADASTLFWNPAAAVRLEGLQVYGGAAVISIGGDFTEDTTGMQHEPNLSPEVPPHLFASYKLNSRWAVGLGAYVPYGLTSQWHTDFPGRFSAIRASLKTIYIQPTLAWDVVPNRFSVGGGPVFGHSSVELYQALDLSQQFLPGSTTARFYNAGIAQGTEFGRAKLKGDANAWGAQFGGQLKLTNTIDLGVRWLWALNFEYEDADATFEQTMTRIVLPAGALGPTQTTAVPLDNLLAPQFATGGALTTRTGSSRIKHPGQVQAGINWSGLPRTNLAFDYTYFTWSDFDVLPVQFNGTNPPPSRTIVEDYENSHRYGASVEHMLDNRFGGRTNNWALRAGFSAATSPAPDVTVTPLLPEQPRKNYTLGLGIPFSDRMGMDIAYLKVDTDGRRGRLLEREDLSLSADEINTGFYRLSANIWTISFRAGF